MFALPMLPPIKHHVRMSTASTLGGEHEDELSTRVADIMSRHCRLKLIKIISRG